MKKIIVGLMVLFAAGSVFAHGEGQGNPEFQDPEGQDKAKACLTYAIHQGVGGMHALAGAPAEIKLTLGKAEIEKMFRSDKYLSDGIYIANDVDKDFQEDYAEEALSGHAAVTYWLDNPQELEKLLTSLGYPMMDLKKADLTILAALFAKICDKVGGPPPHKEHKHETET